MAPLAIGAGGMDMEACPITMSTNDTSGASFSIGLIANMTAYADNDSGCAIFVCDITAAPDRATSAMGTPNAPSSIYSPVDTITDGTSLAIAVAIPALLACSPKREALLWCHPQGSPASANIAKVTMISLQKIH
jgi:hypothetical protein